MADASKNDVPRAADMRVRSSFPHFVHPSPFTCAIRTSSTLSCNAVHPCKLYTPQLQAACIFISTLITVYFSPDVILCAVFNVHLCMEYWDVPHVPSPDVGCPHTTTLHQQCTPCTHTVTAPHAQRRRIAPTSIATTSHASLTNNIFDLHSWTKRSGSS